MSTQLNFDYIVLVKHKFTLESLFDINVIISKYPRKLYDEDMER